MFPEIQERQLSVVDMFLIAWKCLKAKYKDLIKILFVIYMPIAILDSLVSVYLTHDLSIFLNLTMTENAILTDEYMNVFASLIKNQTLLFLISVALGIVGQVAVNHLTYDYLRTKEGSMTITSRAAISYAYTSYMPLVTTGILRLVVVMLGYFCFIFPGIYLEMVFIFFPMAVAFRGKKMKESLLYSKKVMRGNVYRLIIAGMLFYTITMTCSFLLPATENGTTFLALYVTQFKYTVLAFIFKMFWDMLATILFLNFEAQTMGIDVFAEAENE